MPGDTGNCTNCGDWDSQNPNPLGDCGREQLQCNNPCGHSPANTPQCESLPSQITNFTLQLFGTVVKTEMNGVVNWSLPCSLDVGFPSNPRGATEPLACYFLRLFEDGVTGLMGPPGLPGLNGLNGVDAYTQTAQSFVPPSLNSPYVNIVVAYTPTIFAGTYIFVPGAGTFSVINVTAPADGLMMIQATLIYPISIPASLVPIGTLVIPSGVPGASVKGPPGDQGDRGPDGFQGPPGDQGPPGGTALETNGYYTGDGGTGYSFAGAGVYAAVDFGAAGAPSILLTSPGTYLFIVDTIVSDSEAGPNADSYSVKLFDVTNAADIVGSERTVQGFVGGSPTTVPVSFAALITTVSNNVTIALYGKRDAATTGSLVAGGTAISWVRVV